MNAIKVESEYFNMIRVFLTIIHDVKHNKTLIKIVLIASVLHKKKRRKSLDNINVTYLPKEGIHTFDTHRTYRCLRNKIFKIITKLIHRNDKKNVPRKKFTNFLYIILSKIK